MPDFPRPLRALLLLLSIGSAADRLSAQPDLAGWERIVRTMEHASWVTDFETLEPGSVRMPLVPDLDPRRWRPRSAWADKLIRQIEAMPMAEHHSGRALERILADDLLLFRLFQTAADRHRTMVESLLSETGLPAEWVVLPMALTGWNGGYYGPGRRAGAWAMDLPTALSLGLEIRRGWDERHLPMPMARAAVVHASAATAAFPDDPLRQVMAFTRGLDAARRFNPEALDAELLEWCHLLRVIVQVDRNFNRDDAAALWAMRDREMGQLTCPENETILYFSLLSKDQAALRALKEENPWYTTDSVQLCAAAPGLLVPPCIADGLDTSEGLCGRRPAPLRPLPSVSHVVQPGEVLGTIARDYGVRIEEIIRRNGLEGDLIRAGQKLEIPGAHGPIHERPSSHSTVGGEDQPWIWHTVTEGESYWTISRLYPQVDLAGLMRMNDTPPDALRPGMKLRIPPP